MGTTSLWLIIGLMMSRSVSALSNIGYFDFPTGAGECTGNEDVLADFMADAKDLYDGMVAAMDLVSDAAFSTEEEYADYYVARQLLLGWFGITFDDHSNVVDNAESWEILQDGDGDLTAPTYPANLFCEGSMGNFFDWSAVALDVDENNIMVEDQGVSIETLYPTIYAQRNSASSSFGTIKPYYLSSMNRYIFMGNQIDQDICATTLNGGEMYGLTMPGYVASETTTTVTDAAEGPVEVELTYDVMADTVLICPNILTGTVFQYLTLADMTAGTAIEPGSGTGLNTIVTSSSTMFHELIHLTTTWTSDDSINPHVVVDYTYDVGEAVQLAEGILEIPNDPDEVYDAVYAALNAQNYVFFATAWYNWKNNPVSSDDELSAAVFFAGLPEVWYWPIASEKKAFKDAGF
ncbi:uncharacterized protein N7483_002193 [Penicillium malachiteum]|uniref:uncharacterized protein n=1 Tax=Penicillium malachiteum TaxID=1324776 RepID=UPI00254806A9|nr:uncharacterized protein N7483_002193 [Penicillium malachiteum]KAJ5737068.1 hypothetical protein N7483_002193 [Penicillium malachiteum]